MSKIKVNSIEAATGSTVTLPSGQTLDLSSGTVTLPNSSVNLTTKVTGTLPVANGGTGLTTLGSATQVLRVNSGATALEFGSVSSKFVNYYFNEATAAQTISGSTFTFYDITGLSRTITPVSASSKFWIHGRVTTGGDGNHQYIALNCGGNLVHISDAFSSSLRTTSSHSAKATWDMADQVFAYLWEPATTSSVTIKIQGAYESASLQINRGDRDNGTSSDSRASSSMTIFELTT
jgi:hypothetical protein